MGDRVGLPESGSFRIDDEIADGQGGEALVLSLHGDADLHVAGELRQRLTTAIDGGASHLVLDLTGVTFVDSMALGVMLGGMKRLHALGGQLRLVVPQTDVRRIFEITMLDRVLTIDRTRAAALTGFRPGDEL